MMSRGDCFTNADFMVETCAESCNICGKGDPCRPDLTEARLSQPGDLNQIFENAEHDFKDLRPVLLAKTPQVNLPVPLDCFRP